MEIKKLESASLENKKLLFILIGLFISLGITYAAFNTSFGDGKDTFEDQVYDEVEEEEDVPLTEEDTTPPPPPAEIEEILEFNDNIDIMDDEVKIEDDVNFNEDDIEITGENRYVAEVEEEVEEEVIDEVIPFAMVAEKPKFQGGDANDFSKWVNQHLNYPEVAKENGIQGRVMVEFIVQKDGSVTDVKALRSPDQSLSDEAVKVVKSSPKWTPGKQRDRAVPVKYTFPVIFQLR